jgi:hypothetical protein
MVKYMVLFVVAGFMLGIVGLVIYSLVKIAGDSDDFMGYK